MLTTKISFTVYGKRETAKFNRVQMLIKEQLILKYTLIVEVIKLMNVCLYVYEVIFVNGNMAD